MKFHPAPSLRGFTLLEILTALVIFAMTISATMGFFLYSLRTYHNDVGRNMVNSDFRRFTDQMINNVTYANQVYILPNFQNRTTTTTSQSTNVTSLNNVASGTSGDFLVLVYQNPDNGNITRIIGYYRSKDDLKKSYGAGQWPIRMFEVTTDSVASTNLWTLLPDTNTLNSSNHRLLFADSTALGPANSFTNATGLFININGGRSVMINGELCNQGSLLKKRISSRYSFTVSRRS